jgi:hypothetical protein
MVTEKIGHPFIIITGLDRTRAVLTMLSLPKAEAAARIRTPLAEFAVKTTVLLILIFL